jgi:hypothetical protein
LSKDLAKRSGEATLRRHIAELELGQSNERAKELEIRKDAVTSGYRRLSKKYKDLEAKA